MLNVYFENVITRHRKRLAPVTALKIIGTSLLDAENTVLAVYQAGLWRVNGDHYFVVGVESPVSIHFENAMVRSTPIGPYNPTWLVNGAIRAGKSQELALARLDEHSGAWHVYADRTFWSAAVFNEAA
jgi:hypothetical protein